MRMNELLLQDVEKMPKWLENYKPGDKIDLKEVFKSRIIYYPGSRYDGQPVKTFNESHFAHVYIYVDYDVTEEETKHEFLERGFRGYDCFAIHDFTIEDFAPHGWTSRVIPTKEQLEKLQDATKKCKPFGFISIQERKSEFSDEHGAKRFAVIFLCADGIATYDALFGNKYALIHTLVLQDHGFGNNYDSFGKDSLMHKIAKETNTYPKYILCALNTRVWDGYSRVAGVESVFGGEMYHERFLYKKN